MSSIFTLTPIAWCIGHQNFRTHRCAIFWFNTDSNEVHFREREAQAGGDHLLDLAAIQTFLHRSTVYDAVPPEEIPGDGKLAAI